MAKHAVPKKKTSKGRSSTRYKAFVRTVQKQLKNDVTLTKCPTCGATKLNHHVCQECGQYRGKQIIDKQKSVDKAITKIKA